MFKGVQVLEVGELGPHLYPQLCAFPFGILVHTGLWIFFLEASAQSLLFCVHCLHSHHFHHPASPSSQPVVLVTPSRSLLGIAASHVRQHALTLKSAYLGLSPGSTNCWLGDLWWVPITSLSISSLICKGKDKYYFPYKVVAGSQWTSDDKMDVKHLTIIPK